jgi:hypothetical protein
MKPLVYVAGPITGNPFGCVRAAIPAWRWLREHGAVPISPQLSVLHEMIDPEGYEAWMEHDLDLIDRCDALVRLPGESKGADSQVCFAGTRGIPVFHDLDGQLSVWIWTWRR